MSRRRLLAALLAVRLLALGGRPPRRRSPQPRAPRCTDVENGVMCPSCREPLALAQIAAGEAERADIER